MRLFFSSGHAVDFVIAVVACELVALLYWRARRGAGLSVADLIGLQLPGVCLLLALRCALVGADYRWIALCLAASFPFHLFDIMRRSRR